jgi:hypothetical protein
LIKTSYFQIFELSCNYFNYPLNEKPLTMPPSSTKLTLAKFENAFKRQRVVCDSSSDSSSLGEDEQIPSNQNAKSVPAPIPTQSFMIMSAKAEYVATQKYLSQQIKASLEVLKTGISGQD